MVTQKCSCIEDTEKLKKEIKNWKETCEIVSDKKLMGSIKISLNQIAKGKAIPLMEL